MTQPKERPILFSAPMVRAILAGEKTVTRRTVKSQYLSAEWSVKPATAPRHERHTHDWWLPKGVQPYAALPHCPYGQPGDRLWVRETHFINDYRAASVPADERAATQIVYRADPLPCWEGEEDEIHWRPSIHMPRWASRILLDITSVRVERLQAINDEQCLAEGCGVGPGAIGVKLTVPPGGSLPRAMFTELWNSINGASAWDANPWVWVVEFKQVKA